MKIDEIEKLLAEATPTPGPGMNLREFSTPREKELLQEIVQLEARLSTQIEEKRRWRFEAACHAMTGSIAQNKYPIATDQLDKFANGWVAAADALLAELERTEKKDG